MDRRLVFMHVPKTGGTTLHHHLRPAFSEAETCPTRFAELYRFDDSELARWRLFSGHLRMDEIRRIPGPLCLVTVLRDPRARILSLRRFWRRVGLSSPDAPPGPRVARETTDLLGFLRSPEMQVRNAVDNAVARDLAGLVLARPAGWTFRTGPPRAEAPVTRMEVAARALDALLGFDLVGFTEALDAVPPALAALFPGLPDAPAPLPRLNAHDEARADLVAPLPEEAVDAEAEAELEHLTELDRFILRRARELVPPGEAVARPATLRLPPPPPG